MFTSKKKKLQTHIQSLPTFEKNAFDQLLEEYLLGHLKSKMENLGIKRVGIHIDWHDTMKCIGVQGKYGAYRMDVQIYPDEFLIALDTDEPDDGTTYPLATNEQFFSTLSDALRNIK
jgi:hypothetical protein